MQSLFVNRLAATNPTSNRVIVVLKAMRVILDMVLPKLLCICVSK